MNNHTMNRILLVEDDLSISRSLSEFLKTEGFDVICAMGENDAEACLSKTAFDLILLDVTLSDGDGFSVCRKIKRSSNLPVIFLTASGDEFSTVRGFDLGADDYIAKPFRPRELISRIKNALRKAGKSASRLSSGNVLIDTEKAAVYKDGQEIMLSALEYRILLFMFQNKGLLLTRMRLLEEIWDIAGDFVNDNTLTVYIKRIREKIEKDPSAPEIIKTVRGLGYRVD